MFNPANYSHLSAEELVSAILNGELTTWEYFEIVLYRNPEEGDVEVSQ
jgi:hypothetical protein